MALDLEEARSYLHYDPFSGAIYWIKHPKRTKTKKLLAGCRESKNGYTVFKFKRKMYKAHRFAWFLFYGVWPVGFIDHINGIVDDNRIDNLRDVSQSENCTNRVTHRNGKLPGTIRKNCAWFGRIRIARKEIYIGPFDTEIEASNAYVKKREEILNA
jgi:hypothetical protein